jgi:ABC-type uncharacterized transport system substrate-binding protein
MASSFRIHVEPGLQKSWRRFLSPAVRRNSRFCGTLPSRSVAPGFGDFQKARHVAVLLSDKNAYLLPILRRAAAQTNIELAVEPLSDEHGLNRVLNRVSTASALLAIPDSTIYNAETIRTILITTYRRDQLVFGFSTAFVKAGAAATTYSNIEDIAAQVEELLDDFTASGRVPDAQFPSTSTRLSTTVWRDPSIL